MTSMGPFLACGFIALILLAVSMFDNSHQLPPWLLMPILRLRGVISSSKQVELDSEEDVLAHQLEHVDMTKDPEKAQKLHTALGNMLRASGSSKHRVVSHFESARTAAKHGRDPDTILASHIGLAEAYVEEGRPLDSQKELLEANQVMANHFGEHVVSLNRARGRAKFELGFIDSALQYYEMAEKQAIQPEDRVRVACDISMIQTCRGETSKSMDLLKRAQEVLSLAQNQGMTDELYATLNAEVYFRRAEVFHLTKQFDTAKAFYGKALDIQRKFSKFRSERVTEIRNGLKNIDRRIKPELHCPSLPEAPWETPKNLPSASDPEFLSEIHYLIEDEKYSSAESKLNMALKSSARPYVKLDDAVALNLLGDVYSKQSKYAKAARKYRQALHAALDCCGAEFPEAEKAYKGLKALSSKLPDGSDRKSTELSIRHYVEFAKEHGEVDAKVLTPGDLAQDAVKEAAIRDASHPNLLPASRHRDQFQIQQSEDPNGGKPADERVIDAAPDDDIGFNPGEFDEEVKGDAPVDDIGFNPGEFDEEEKTDDKSKHLASASSKDLALVKKQVAEETSVDAETDGKGWWW